MARRVRDEGVVGELYKLATLPAEELPKPIRHKVFFRGAYTLERVYFGYTELFQPYIESFCAKDFAVCSDVSARRHFAKIMADLLGYYTPELSVLEGIAEAAAMWAAEPKSKVAVRVWALEVLRHCKNHIDWVDESWHDLLALLARDTTPGIEVRLRKLKVES
jgi:hypothetical protein